MNAQQHNYYISQAAEIEALRVTVAGLSQRIEILSDSSRIVLSENHDSALVRKQEHLNSGEEVYSYCKSMSSYTREVFRVLFLSTKNQLIADEIVSIGTTCSCPVEVNEICRLAIKYGAQKVITVHNHPSGDPKPSEDDFKIAVKIAKMLALFKIVLADNLIIGQNSFACTDTKKVRCS